MKKSLLLAILIYASLSTAPVYCSELSNFLRPYGFATPMLEQGQYALNLNFNFQRMKSEYDYEAGLVTHSETVAKWQYFSVNGIYAITNQLIIESNVDFYPNQRRYLRKSVYSFDSDLEQEEKSHLDFTIAPDLGLSFKPRRNIECYGRVSFLKETLDTQNKDGQKIGDQDDERLLLNVGITILGGL